MLLLPYSGNKWSSLHIDSEIGGAKSQFRLRHSLLSLGAAIPAPESAAEAPSGRPRRLTGQEISRWQFDQLLEFLTDNPDGITGNVERGAVVFEKAQCIKCHRYGSIGEGIGPDLTTLRRRFRRKEILESIFYPSHVISDQYQSRTLVTLDGKVITGLVAPQGADAIVVLDIEGKKTVIAKQEIEQQLPSKLSAMPEGLLNPLSMQQIADLFALFDAIPVTDDEAEIP